MKEFRVPRPEHDALEFALIYDRRVKSGEWEEQTDKFKARGNVPGNLLVSLTASMAASEGLQAKELQRLLSQAILPEDAERFFKILDDPDVIVPIQTLGDIMNWLAEEYSNRPTLSA